MTEDEAKLLWCPEARVSLYHRSTDANRMVRYGSGEGSEDHQAFLKETRCLGSGCAVWRWMPRARTEGDVREGYCGKAPY